MKRHTAIIITACAIAVAVASMAFCIVQNNQRNKAYERMYEQLRSQGYDDTDEEVASSSEDSLGVDSCQTDTTEFPTEETFQKAEMAQEMLKELHYPIMDTDTLYNHVNIIFKYEGEYMRIIAANNQPGIIVEDMSWDSVSLDTPQALYAMMVTINRANYCYPFKILYAEDAEDEDVLNIVTRQQLLMNEFTPEGAKLLEVSVKSMVRIHEYFQNTMVGLIQEMMEKK